jgi:hypothetical protein
MTKNTKTVKLTRLIFLLIVLLVFLAGVVAENRIHLLQDAIDVSPGLIAPVQSLIQRMTPKDIRVLSSAAGGMVLPLSLRLAPSRRCLRTGIRG